MNGNAYYSNKGWARKVMTILLDKMVMFETLERRENEQCAFGEYQIGVKFFSSVRGTSVTIWPTCESDLNEVRNLLN